MTIISAVGPPDGNLPSTPTSRNYSAAAILQVAAASSATTSASANSTSAEDKDNKTVLNKKNPSLPSESSVLLAYHKDLLSSSSSKEGGTLSVNNTNININSHNHQYFQGQRTGLSKSNSFRDLSSSSKEAALRAQRILDNYQSSSFRIRGKLLDKTTSTLLDQSLLDGLDLSVSAGQGLDLLGTSKNRWDPILPQDDDTPNIITKSSAEEEDVKGNKKFATSSRYLQKKTSNTRHGSPRRVPSNSVEEDESPSPSFTMKRTNSDKQSPRSSSPPSGRDGSDRSSRHGASPRESKSLRNVSPRRAPSKSHHKSEEDSESPAPKHKLRIGSEHAKCTRSPQASPSRRDGLDASSRHQTKRISKAVTVTKLSASSTHHCGAELMGASSSSHQHHRGAVKKSHSTRVAAQRSSSLSPVRYNSTSHGAKSDTTSSPKRSSSSRTKGCHRRTKNEDAAGSPKWISNRATRQHVGNRDLESNQLEPQPGNNDMQDFSAFVDIDDEENENNNNDSEHNRSNKNDHNNDDMKDFSSTVDIDTDIENSYCSECETGDSYSSDSNDEKSDSETRLSPRRRATATTKRATSHRGRVNDSRGHDAASDARASRRRRDGTDKSSTNEIGCGSGSNINESRRRRAERRAAKENSPVRKISGADRTTRNAGIAGRRGHHGRVRNTTSTRAANLERNQLAKAVESSDPAATLALIAGYDREYNDDDQQPSEEFNDNNNDEVLNPPRMSSSSAGLLRSVASTTAKTGLNVASTVACQTGLKTVASTVASTKVAKTGLTGLKALTTFSTAASSAATRALKQGKGLIYGEGAFHIMVDGVAPGHSLAKFIKEMESGAIDNVNTSWKELQKHRSYAEKAGILLFTHLFESCPSAKGVFGFPADADPRSENVRQDPAFTKHASYLINMIEKAIGLLNDKGPAPLELQSILFDLGKKHCRMGVEQTYFPFMGQALVDALREMLGRKCFTLRIEKSWVLVYNVLAAEMCHGMNTDKIVIAAWAQLKTVPYYKEKAGLLIFQHLFQNCPDSKELFGFPSDFKTDTKNLKESMRFRMHAEYFIVMFDKVLTMVETHSVDRQMRDLGKKHLRNGIKVEYFPVMGVGLIHALEVLLKQDFNDVTREAWISAYARLSSRMISEMRRASQ